MAGSARDGCDSKGSFDEAVARWISFVVDVARRAASDMVVVQRGSLGGCGSADIYRGGCGSADIAQGGHGLADIARSAGFVRGGRSSADRRMAPEMVLVWRGLLPIMRTMVNTNSKNKLTSLSPPN